MGNLLPENRNDNKLSDVDNPDPLNLAVRSQQNFAENVPRLSHRNTPQFSVRFVMEMLRLGSFGVAVDCTWGVEWTSCGEGELYSWWVVGFEGFAR